MARENKAVHLGAILSDKLDNMGKVFNELAECTVVANKLKLFWNRSKCRYGWKLLVYDAVAKSKLLYGLESVQLSTKELQRIAESSTYRPHMKTEH